MDAPICLVMPKVVVENNLFIDANNKLKNTFNRLMTNETDQTSVDNLIPVCTQILETISKNSVEKDDEDENFLFVDGTQVTYDRMMPIFNDWDTQCQENLRHEISREEIQENQNPATVQTNLIKIMDAMHRSMIQAGKSLPGCSKFQQDDHIVLFKNTLRETMVLWIVREYRNETPNTVWLGNRPYLKEHFVDAGFGDVFDELLQFSQLVHSMEIDDTEYIFLFAFCLFTERPGVMNNKMVRTTRRLHEQILQEYLLRKHGAESTNRLTKLYSIQPKLLILGCMFRVLLLKLKQEGVQIAPLIQEIWECKDY